MGGGIVICNAPAIIERNYTIFFLKGFDYIEYSPKTIIYGN